MRNLLPYLAAVVLSLALTAPAAAERGAVVSARAEHVAATARVSEAAQARDALAERSRVLAEAIVRAKAERRQVLPGVGGGQLDRLLKEAQALGERLQVLDRQVAQARARARGAREALVASIEQEMAGLRRIISGASAQERRQLFEALKGLISEHRQLLAAASSEQRPAKAVSLPAVESEVDASPDELRELADEVRDHEERVRAQLRTLEGRLGDLKARRRVIEAAQDFAADSNLFGEDERNRRVARVDGQQLGVAQGERDGQSGGSTNGPDLAAAPQNAGDGDGAVVVGEENEGFAGAGDQEAAPPPMDAPAAEAPSPGSDDGARGEPDVDEAFGEAGGGAADPGAEVFTPTGVPVGVDAAGSGGDLVLSQGIDPQLLVGDVDDLSPEALADYIEQVEAQKDALKQTARALQQRQDQLERRADAIEEAP